MFGEALQEDDLMNELDAMCAADVEGEIADLGPLPDIPNQVPAEQEEVAEAPKRKLVAAWSFLMGG